MTTEIESVRDRAANIIEPRIDVRFKRRQHAERTADMLQMYGLLAGQKPYSVRLDVTEQAANVLQGCCSWPVAERITAELAKAGLLAKVG